MYLPLGKLILSFKNSCCDYTSFFCSYYNEMWKKKFWHGNQLFELFLCSYALLQKNKKLRENLGYIIVFLQKWIAAKKKFKKLISVGAFFFFSVSRRIDPRSRMSRKQKRSEMLWPTCTKRFRDLFLPLALTIFKKLFDTFLKMLVIKNSFTKLLLFYKAYNF